MSEKELHLRVQDSDPTHVGRNIVTLDRKSKDALGVTSGDIIEIKGQKKTAAVIWPARSEDEGKSIIRMDNFIRHNSGVGLGDTVTIKKAAFKEAKEVILAPTEEVRIIASGYGRILKKSFLGRPLTQGDSVWISVFGSGFVYRVLNTKPKGIVKVTDFTQFVLKEKPVKAELEGVPTVAYEDIGGLKEQIKKVREMVELPMRHPELFRKLGIVPPKGILLYGPPGTGKTLLAKAVANETNAHFISINAPEIMCVDAKTPILTNPAGMQTAESIFNNAGKSGRLINDGKMKIVELSQPKKVYSLDKNLKIAEGKITHVTKLRAKTVKIKTSLNDEFTVSSNQPFATMDAFGSIVWKTSSEIRKGNYLAVAKELPEGRKHKFEFKDIRSKRKDASIVSLPEESSPELMRFLGFMYSEGCLQKDGFCFANTDPILKEEFAYLVRELFALEPKIKKNKVNVYSVTLRRYLLEALGFPEGKKGDYSLPKWIFSLTRNETASFIQGYWEGDGTVSKGTGNYPTIRIYASGKKVLKDLCVLLRKLGIVSKVRNWGTPYGKMFALVLIGNRARELFAENIKSNVKKYSLVSKWYNKRKKKGDDLVIPNISPLLKEIKEREGLVYGKNLEENPAERYISGRDPLTQRKLEEISLLLGSKDKRLKKVFNSHLCWAKVTEIKHQGEKNLYDLTVEPFNNFLGGHSLTVLHNSKFVGEAEERLRQVFKEAEENAPSIVFFDEIDAIAPKRDEVIGEVERRVVAQLLALMDGLEARGNVIVMAATNRVNSLDEALRRPGRFDREIEFSIPDRKERKEILQIHTRGMPLAKDVDLAYFATITHGFVGADLAALAKESAMKALRRYLPEINLEEEKIPPEILEKLEVNKDDFHKGLKDVQPSALREVAVQIPKVKWADIGGLEKAKKELKQAVEWPLKSPKAFAEMGITPPKGILLYGPPGCGKTLIAKAVATESEANFISVKGPEILSMYVGESERGVRKIFRKARQVSPVIVFFDEIDSIASTRGNAFDSGVGNRVLDQLLTELDGLEGLKDVVFMAATNRPDLVDQALLRPGRVDKLIEIEAPNEKAREQILKVHAKNVPLSKNVSFKALAEKTDGFSGADLEGLVREAVLLALEESRMKKTLVKKVHFEKVLDRQKPTINDKTKEAYGEFREHFAEYRPSYVR